MDNKKQTDINISSGIRQGCNCSSTLFILITYYIIEKLYNRLREFNNNHIKIVYLFYADNGLILEDNEEETRKSIHSIRNIASEVGISDTANINVQYRSSNFDK